MLLQRIAYLFYRNRGSLDPRQVFLISPNPVFAKYIENVLPDLGERNPETITYRDLCARLLPAGRNPQDKESPLELLWKIDRAVEGLRSSATFATSSSTACAWYLPAPSCS